MKLVSALAIAISFVGASALARPETTGKEILNEMEDLALKCVVRPFTLARDGSKVYSDLRNTCPQIQVIDSVTARVLVKGEQFQVVLKESEDTDGGDLDHVLVYNLEGRLVAQQLNVLAFDNILMGLAGGKHGFQEVQE
ncbi:MAG: hypothetical protein ACM3MG_08485 [Bacillota bacterium]